VAPAKLTSSNPIAGVPPARGSSGMAGRIIRAGRECRVCGRSEREIFAAAPVPHGLALVLLDIATPTGVCIDCAIELGWDPNQLRRLWREDMARELLGDATWNGTAELLRDAD